MNASLFLTLQHLYQGVIWAEGLLGAPILSRPRYFLKASLCPLYSMVELICIVSPEAESVSRRWWLCHSPGKRQAECRFEETQILPPIRRVHGSAIGTALKSLLGFARSSQQNNYEIMALNWSCGLGCRTLPGKAIDSQHTASEDREVVWSVLLCSFLPHTGYDHCDTGIQFFSMIAGLPWSLLLQDCKVGVCASWHFYFCFSSCIGFVVTFSCVSTLKIADSKHQSHTCMLLKKKKQPQGKQPWVNSGFAHC